MTVIIPTFFGLNFLLIMVLYRVLARQFLPWLAMIVLPVAVFLLAYPSLYVGSHLTGLFPLKFPADDLLAMGIFVFSGWLLATGAGCAGIVSYLRRSRV